MDFEILVYIFCERNCRKGEMDDSTEKLSFLLKLM